MEADARRPEATERYFSQFYGSELEAVLEAMRDAADQQEMDVEMVKAQLHDDLKKDKVDKTWAEVNRNAEVFGLGVAEIQIKSMLELQPSMQPMPDGMGAAIGVTETDRVSVAVKSVHPRNFVWDPNSETVEDSLGVAVEEYASLFKIVKGIEDGVYRKVNIGPEFSDADLIPNQLDSLYQEDEWEPLDVISGV